MGYVLVFVSSCSFSSRYSSTCQLPYSIKQLSKLISEHAPSAIKEGSLSDLNGRKIAIDGSMAIYQVWFVEMTHLDFSLNF
jgi:hypothetical protein